MGGNFESIFWKIISFVIVYTAVGYPALRFRSHRGGRICSGVGKGVGQQGFAVHWRAREESCTQKRVVLLHKFKQIDSPLSLALKYPTPTLHFCCFFCDRLVIAVVTYLRKIDLISVHRYLQLHAKASEHLWRTVHQRSNAAGKTS